MAVLSFSSFKGEKSDNENKVAVTTTSISGTIIDELSGETLVGVEVQLKGTETKVYTDFDGNFKFSDIPVGKCELTAKLISYRELNSKAIELVASEKCNLKLKMKQVN